jgi:hypothetical protein
MRPTIFLATISELMHRFVNDETIHWCVFYISFI